jgi:hypothetical protein
MSGEACGVELRVIGNVAMNAKRYGARARVYVHETKRATPRRAGTRAPNSDVSRAFFRGFLVCAM